MNSTAGHRTRWVNYIGAVLALLVFGVYLSTVCPTVYVGDSGELSAAAYSLGIPHSSGYPLYALLGKLFCMIPLGHAAFRINLLSAVFAVAAVWLVYDLILKITACQVSAVFASLLLAFAPMLWSQSVFAEVYTLHAFFVALLTRLLWQWDNNKQLRYLALFVFITGVSFGNHLQTLMLVPAVLVIVLSANHPKLWRPGNVLALLILFGLSLCLYIYLPIRTQADAAIHWGDPDNLSRFIAHVSARSHRENYIFTKSGWDYVIRTQAVLWAVVRQFGLAIAAAVWGWIKLTSNRWRLFFLCVVLFDIFYSVFLNIISLEITPFGIPSCIAVAVLIGVGTAHILKAIACHPSVGRNTRNAACLVLCLGPAIPLLANYGFCDQSRNTVAYEHAVNIFRTAGSYETIILDGDNNIFPVVYGRIVERMREDVKLYDRPNVLFKRPDMDVESHTHRSVAISETKDLTKDLKQTAKKQRMEMVPGGAYYAVFNPAAVHVPRGYTLRPYGILHKMSDDTAPWDFGGRIWPYYVTLGLEGDFRKDFMTRQVAAYFHIARGKYFFMIHRPEQGLKFMQLASAEGFDDTTIHSDIAVFLTDRGYFEQARTELDKAMTYHDDLSGVYNNWGYYHFHLGNFREAVISYRKAIELRPDNHGYYNNLGLALYQAGNRSEAAAAFRKSLSIKPDQPEIEEFLKAEK